MKSIANPNQGSTVKLLVTIVTIVVFVAMLGRRDVVTSHEARVAQTGRIMLASGAPWNATPIVVPIAGLVDSPDGKRAIPLPLEGTRLVNPWLVPVIDGQIRLQKPPLPYWCTAAMYQLLSVNEFAVRIVPALLGALATLLIFDLAKIVLGSRAALPAAMVWITTQFINDEFRRATADPYLAFFTLLAVWSWMRGRRVGTIAFYLAVALGLLAKGPPMFVSLAPAIAIGLLVLKRRRQPGSLGAHLIGLVILLAIAAPWFIYVVRTVPHAIELWRYESIGEFGDNAEKSRPWWLYALTSAQLPLPWTPMWIAGLCMLFWRGRKKLFVPRARRRWFAVGWFIITLGIFSCAHVKKNAYLLPVMPAQTLIIADAVATTIVLLKRSKLRELSSVLFMMQIAIAAGFAIGLPVKIHFDRMTGTIGYLLAGAALIAAIFAIRSMRRRDWTGWLYAIFVSYAVLLVALDAGYRSELDNRRSPRPFARAVAEYARENDLPLAVTCLPEEATFYMPLDLRADASASRVLLLFDHGRRDPPMNATILSNLLGGETVRGFRQIQLLANNGGGRWLLFDVIVDRNRA